MLGEDTSGPLRLVGVLVEPMLIGAFETACRETSIQSPCDFQNLASHEIMWEQRVILIHMLSVGDPTTHKSE